MHILPLSRQHVRNIYDNDAMKGQKWALISVASFAKDHLDFGTRITSDCHGIMQMMFADIDSPRQGLVLFDRARARDIITFFENVQPYIEVLLVNCYAGQSRSPAIAAAISKAYYDTDNDYFNRYTPNMLVYRTILEVHHEIQEKRKDEAAARDD